MTLPSRFGFFVFVFFVQTISLQAETIRVGFPSLATGFAPSWVTADKGLWKKHGLEVDLIYLRGGSRTVSAMVGGSIDIIIGSDIGTIQAILQGAELVKLGVTTNTLGYSMIGRPNLRSLKDLKGKIIGITQGRDASYSRVIKVLQENGLDASKDVKFLPIAEGPSGRLAALSSGVIDATMFTPPTDMIAERSGMKNLSRIDVANVGGGITTMKTIVQNRRPVLVRFLKGYIEGIHYLKGHKDESLKIFSKYTRNPNRDVMLYLYEEITTRVATDLQPEKPAVRALLDLVALDYPQVKQWSETDHWDTTLIDEIEQSGFVDQLYR
jgi:ABC-type nitrate/sulfonate/bicarbonate transport system substrate-binding protein